MALVPFLGPFLALCPLPGGHFGGYVVFWILFGTNIGAKNCQNRVKSLDPHEGYGFGAISGTFSGPLAPSWRPFRCYLGGFAAFWVPF